VSHALDLQADALLRALIEQHGGDLTAAGLMLCAGITLADLDGEDFERALHRAVGALFRRPPFGLPLGSVEASKRPRSESP